MKTLNLLLMLCCGFLFPSAVYAQVWTTVNTGFNSGYISVDFVNPLDGWVAAAGGEIIHTSNGGATWTLQYSQENCILWDIVFADELHGWAVGEAYQISRAVILHTVNGGVTWTGQTLNSIPALWNLSVVDTSICWAAGSSSVVQTFDGETWFTQHNSTVELLGVHGFNDLNCCVVGSAGMVLFTMDGGTNWIEQHMDIVQSWSNVKFLNMQTGWMVGTQGTTLRTVDGGVTWEIRNTPATETLYDLCFVDSLHGWAVGNNEYIVYTENGGQNWTTQRLIPDPGWIVRLWCTDFVDGQHGWAAGSHLFKYVDSQGINLNHRVVDFDSVLMNTTDVQLLSIRNFGATPLIVSSMTAPNGFSSRFNLPLTIAAGDSVTDTLQFLPEFEKVYSGNLEIISNARGGVSRVYLRGKGASPLQANHDSLQFGSIDLGENSYRLLILRNRGSVPLTVSSITTTEGFTTSFTIPMVIQGSSAVSDTVCFSPTRSQSFSGSLVFATTNPAISSTVTLRGIGISPLQTDPFSLIFDSTPVCSEIDQLLTLRNPGSIPLTVDSITGTEAFYSSFHLPVVIPVNGSVTDTVRFIPAAAVPYNGSLSVTSSEYGVVGVVPLSGTGAPSTVVVFPTILIFNDVYINQTTWQIFNIQNAQDPALIITDISVPPWLVVSFTPPLTIQGWNFVQSQIHFNPTVEGPYEGFLVMTSNSSTSPTIVPIRGNGISLNNTDSARVEIPTGFYLSQNYPNPFNATTEIIYSLPQPQQLRLTVFDITGRVVSLLCDGMQQAGEHRVTFDGSDFASGIFFARLEANSTARTLKMILLK